MQQVEYRWLPDDTPLCTTAITIDGKADPASTQPGTLHVEEQRLGAQVELTPALPASNNRGNSSAEELQKLGSSLWQAVDNVQPVFGDSVLIRQILLGLNLRNCLREVIHSRSKPAPNAVEGLSQPWTMPKGSMLQI